MVQRVGLPEAVAALVRDGDSVAPEGFTHLIPFAAGDEVLRQGVRDLELIRMTPDILYDQMIGVGAARKLVFSYVGNPGVGSLHRLRDAVEHGWPAPLEIEEHSHAGMANRFAAGAARLPMSEPALAKATGTDIPDAAFDPTAYDLDAIGREAAAGGDPVIPLVDQLPDGAHAGATSQDILDTGLMLIARRALGLLLEDAEAAAARADELAAEHVNMPMIGRTLLQHAQPTTFGAKAGAWSQAITAATAALAELPLPVQMGGPVGTRDDGAAAAVAEELGLAPSASWQSDRTPVTRLGCGLGVLTAALGKVGHDVVLLSQNEVSEVREGAPGGSSSMPDKRNPVASRAGGTEPIADTVVGRRLTPAFAAEHPDTRARLRAMLTGCDAEGYAACCGVNETLDLRATLPNITPPTLVVAAAADPSIPPHHGELIAGAVPGARYELVEDAAHIASVQQPEAITRLIIDRLEAP